MFAFFYMYKMQSFALDFILDTKVIQMRAHKFKESVLRFTFCELPNVIANVECRHVP